MLFPVSNLTADPLRFFKERLTNKACVPWRDRRSRIVYKCETRISSWIFASYIQRISLKFGQLSSRLSFNALTFAIVGPEFIVRLVFVAALHHENR